MKKHSHSQAPALNEQLVIVKDDNTYTTSRKVAEIFAKRHDNVLRDVEKIKEKCSRDFTRLNFEVSIYRYKSGKKNKEYRITKNGFIMLAIQFRQVVLP